MTTSTAIRPALPRRPSTHAPAADPMLVPLLLWAGVLMLVMLFFYVQLVLAQVARGERLREDQRARAELAATTVVKLAPRPALPPARLIRVSQHSER